MKDKVCEHILYWVEDNLITTNTVVDLEEETGYSRSTLERWFHRKYDMPLGTYLYRRRMSRAAMLLRMTMLPITDIAELFHYYSSQNFTRAFLRFADMTPSMHCKSSEWKMLPIQLPLFANQQVFINSKIVEQPDLYIQEIQMYEEDSISISSHDQKIKKQCVT